MESVLLKMNRTKLHEVRDFKCPACRKQRTRGLSDDDGHMLCLDCYGGWTEFVYSQPKRVPQGDTLLRMPFSPRFTKKFS